MTAAPLPAGAAELLTVHDPDGYFVQVLYAEEHGWLQECGASMVEVGLTEAIEQALCRSDKAIELYE
ncbi:hypothetical protein [Hymenobacter sp. 102]|uniref:hypothetical protein n=1 Tax=Hymenobacter sp. 102 TaxID=3403152 RepID=UPI003CF9D7F1